MAKWRTIYAGWQLGTRQKGDPESDAVRDASEARLLMRAEINGFTKILLENNLITAEELREVFTDEYNSLADALSERFKGMRATDDGIEFYDIQAAAETMKGWKP